MLSKKMKNNNNVLLIDSQNENIYLLFWNKFAKKYNQIQLEFDRKDLKEIVEEEEFSTKKTIVKVDKTVYQTPLHHKNSYSRIIELFKKYDKQNYKPYDVKDIDYLKNGLVEPEDEIDDEWVPQEPYESYDQLSYKNMNCWRLQ